MARELGLSPKRFSKYADRKNQPWKLPLTQFIEALYLKQFGKERPDEVKTMEEIAAAHVAKRAARKLANVNKASDSENSASTSDLTEATFELTNNIQIPAHDPTKATDETTAASLAPPPPPDTHQCTVPPATQSATDKTREEQPASEADHLERDTPP